MRISERQMASVRHLAIRFATATFVLLGSFPALAAEVLVEASVIKSNQEQAANSVRVITEEELISRGAHNVEEVLREIAGLDVARSGGQGQASTVMIRGANSHHTLVIIDGIEVNDPLNPSGGFDFAQVSTTNIERIEIFAGPQTVRFGSGALGGVIRIFSKEGQGAPKYHGGLEAGAHGYSQMHAATSGKGDRLGYSIAVSQLKNQANSAADEKQGNPEKDAVSIHTVSSKLNWKLSKTADIGLVGRLVDTKSDLDARGGVGGDDPNYTSTYRQLNAGLTANEFFFSESLRLSLGAHYLNINRGAVNLQDPANTSDLLATYLSDARKLDSEAEWFFGGNRRLRANLVTRAEAGNFSSRSGSFLDSLNRREHGVSGLGMTYLDQGAVLIDVGVRVDRHTEFGTILSHRASLGYEIIKSTKLSLTTGSGFKTPSLYQLYSNVGDTGLRPELARSTELGVDIERTGLDLRFTLFQSRFSDLIDFDTRYRNLAQAEVAGLISSMEIKDQGFSKLQLQHTYEEALDSATRLSLLRRPRHKVSAAVEKRVGRWLLGLRYRWAGQREDGSPVNFGTRDTLPAYDVLDLSSAYDITRALRFGARLENVFNSQYQEVNGYGTLGRAIYFHFVGEM